jgi:hypothetical protein
MDNFHIAQSLTGMANSNEVIPIYSVATNESTYPRQATNQACTPLDTKSIYPPTWTVPYAEDTSPVETYDLGQSISYIADNVPVTNSSLYGPSYHRWTCPTSRSFQQATNVYFDQDPYPNVHDLMYTANKNRITETGEPLSPMNMSSLGMALPPRPHPHRYGATDEVARQLPFPQPNPAQTSRNALDNLQNQRLRSGQGSSTSFTRILQPWNPNNDSIANATTTTSIENSAPVAATTDGALGFLATAAVEDNASVAGTATSPELNFSLPSLLDTKAVSAPINKYSNFRESRNQCKASGNITRHDSHTNLYSYDTHDTPKRNPSSEENSEERKLVNGHQYIPLAHQQTPVSSNQESLQGDSIQNRDFPPQRVSIGSLSTPY